MKKHTTKPTAIIFLILFSTSIFANKKSNYPEGFSPKTNSGVVFTENKGQVHDQHYKARPDVLFGGTAGNLTFHLKNNGISYQLTRVDTWKKESDLTTKKAGFENAEAPTKLVADQTTIYRLDINWLNANKNAELIKQNPLEGLNNYYLENCPNGVLNVKSYQQITYQNIYKGIDLKWYEKEGHLEYDYLVSAGADYKKIQLEIKGADKITVNNKGELIYKTPLGNIIEQAPVVKQSGKTLKSRWLIKNDVLSFEIENINKNEAFIIDPVVRIWGTYYGGNNDDQGRFCAVDNTGNVFLTGFTAQTGGTAVATIGSHQSVFAGGSSYDAFLAKFNSSGVRQWGTYYGGTANENGNSCAADATGNVYLTGTTQSSLSALATSGGHQSAYGGGTDAFLVKFNSLGVRQWGTYYGGGGDDGGYSCVTDATGNVYMAGFTDLGTSTIIATSGSHQSSSGGGADAFLVKFNSAGIRQWGTYYGGSGDEGAYPSCAIDAIGSVYLAGYTSSSLTAIATVGSHQTAYGGGTSDAFLVKFNSLGVRQWGTYYGGSGNEGGFSSCAIDATSNVYLAGTTSSSGSAIATLGSHQSAYAGGWDAFLVKFNSAGVRQWGTYYGGIGEDRGYSCAVDATSNVYLAGRTSSSVSAIATLGSHQSAYGGGTYDGFLVQFNGAGFRQWGTYYGGSGNEGHAAAPATCAADANGNVYLAGTTSNSPSAIATLGSHQTSFGGSSDAFLVKFSECASPTITVNSGSICSGQSYTIVPTGASTYTYLSGSAIVTPTVTASYSIIGTSSLGCFASNTAISSVTVNTNPTITVNSGAICAGQNFTINPAGAGTYTIQGGNAVVSPSISSTYTVIGTSTEGCVSQAFATSSLTVNASPILSISGNTSICAGETSTLIVGGGNTYQWSTGASSNSITINQSPNSYNYTVTATGTNSCISSGTIQVIINACTGIEKIKAMQVRIFPNPNNGEFTIELAGACDTYIIITNVLGQLIKTQKAELINQINLNEFEKGMYLINVIDNNQSIYRGSIIKE